MLDELAGLLEWESRKAFSVEDREEGGMLHKCVIEVLDTVSPTDMAPVQLEDWQRPHRPLALQHLGDALVRSSSRRPVLTSR